MAGEGQLARLASVTSLVITVVSIAACISPADGPVGETPEVVVSSPSPSPPTPVASAVVGGPIREPALAGTWYPADAGELAAMVDGMLDGAGRVPGEPLGLVVPHAGLVYSGQVAAQAFKQLEGGGYGTAVIIASDHQAPVSAPISVWAEGGYGTPLGVVPVDEDLAGALVAADPRISFDADAHRGEHPIEIELPLLQRACPSCTVVPVLMGRADDGTVDVLAEALLTTLAGDSGDGRRVVVVASSDLSHFPTYDDGLVADGATLAAIETFDPHRVRQAIRETMARGLPNLETCACGEAPIRVVMRVSQGLGADTATVLGYANSGDVSGDHSRVVGYGAVMFWRYETPQPTVAQQEELLGLARTAIAGYLETGQIPAYETDDPLFTGLSGVFVTLKEGGELRGCIGHTQASLPLYRAVQQMAVAAATQDARFPALTPAELSEVSIEISILSPFRRIVDVEGIEVGTHGLLLLAGRGRGLLLPQVPVEQGWDREAYLDNLCLKAGLPAGCYQQGVALYTFTAVVFEEE